MSNYEPCSICEEYIEGVICNKDNCPVWKMKKENAEQKAEIDELRDVCGKCPMLKSKNNIIDSLKEQIKGWQQGYCELRQELKTAKAEAIKEFAERSQDSKHECGCNYRKKPVYAVTEDKIDNLVKEMAGETE